SCLCSTHLPSTITLSLSLHDALPIYFEVYELLLESVENVFTEALPGEQSLVNCFTTVVDEAIDNLVEYGRGGIIGGLYYPKIGEDRKSTRLNSSHQIISYAVFCLKKK